MLHYETHTYLSTNVKLSLRLLWNKEYPENLYLNDIKSLNNYLKDLESPIHYLVYNYTTLIGWMTVFVRNNKTWFAIIIDAKYKGRKIGSTLLSNAKEKYEELNG